MTLALGTHDKPLAIVLGMSPTGLYAVRELGRAGVPVAGVGSPMEPALASNFLKKRIEVRSRSEALQVLKTAFKNEPCAPILIPTSDEYIELIGDHASDLSDHFRFQASYKSEVWRLLLDKMRFYSACEKAGIPFPRIITANPGSLSSSATDIAFPLLIKPSQIHKAKQSMRGKKVWIAKSHHDLKRLDETIPLSVGTLIIQEIIPGPESDIVLWAGYIDAHGSLHQPFTARKLRQYPPGFGSASLVQSVCDDELSVASAKLLRTLGFEGIAAVEWKRDARDGKLKIIEINARPSLWFGLTSAAGKFITLQAYHILSGNESQVEEGDQINGIRWRYTLRDMYSSAFYRRARDFVLPPPDVAAVQAPVSSVNAVYSNEDPMPALADLRMIVAKGTKRLLSR